MPTRSRHFSRRIGKKLRIARPAILVLLSVALFGADGAAQGPGPYEFKWDELQKQGRLTGGVLLAPDAQSSFHHLKVDNNRPGPLSVTVWTIDRPPVSAPQYVVTGQVRYDGVEGTGYLELWNHFPDGRQFFSRTLGETGPMQKLQGSSGWRSFALPFDATGAPAPSRLVLNVVFNGKGSVELGPLKLQDVQQSRGRTDSGIDRLAGLGGGAGGALLGVLGALVGMLTSLGRARRFVMALTTGLIALGVVLVIGGVFAIATGQRYAVFYPMLLLGILSSAVPFGLLPAIRRRYAEIELRMMRAHDIR